MPTGGPTLLRFDGIWMATDLSADRRERIRSQERAEVAAHVHDSVLQTLALIQKAAGSPAVVSSSGCPHRESPALPAPRLRSSPP